MEPGNTPAALTAATCANASLGRRLQGSSSSTSGGGGGGEEEEEEEELEEVGEGEEGEEEGGPGGEWGVAASVEAAGPHLSNALLCAAHFEREREREREKDYAQQEFYFFTV